MPTVSQAATIDRRDRLTLALAEGAIVVGTALGFVLSYIALWHCYFRTIQTSGATAPRLAETLGTTVARVEAPRRARPPGRPSDARTQVRALVEAARARGEHVSGADVGRAIGRSPQRGRALLAEVLAETPASNGAWG
ncbi:MAG TPA: hypothetical protein VMU20_03480 [Candidatus Dormibacteraeota bacterium]|nr:hypothetical protein [Candidatus Dormibacteraeota bacterium]